MIDPCRGEKCILYPRCMHKQTIKCDVVDAWIEIVTEGHRVNKSLTLAIYLYFTYSKGEYQLKEIWKIMKYALPNLKCINYRGYRFYENDDDREVVENDSPMH